MNPKKSILLLDDKKDVAQELIPQLKKKGYSITQVASEKEALDFLKTNAVSVVVTDFLQGKILQVVKSQGPSGPQTILLSNPAHLGPDEVFDLGAIGPMNPQELIHVIEKVVENQRELKSRHHARHKCSLAAEISYRNNSITQIHQVLNMGQGGMFVQASKDEKAILPEINEVVEFKMQLEGGKNQVFSGAGLCRWIRMDAQFARPQGVGLEFLFLEEKAQEQLTRALNQLKKK